MSRVTQALRNARSEPATRRPASGRALVAACVGNLVEWYDFAVYGSFATIIAVTFFPGADPTARLLASFAVFATAFLVRPVGALLFGRLGDRMGRRRVLAMVIVLMAVATAGIGLLPGYATIGMFAPLLLILLRSAQGLSVGGETGGATAFVVEYAPANRRGWYGAGLWATLALGVAGGIGVAILLARVFSRATLEGWGWRLAFLATLPLGLVGLYLRLRLDETPRFRAAQRARAVARRPVIETVRGYPGRLLIGFGLVAASALTFNLFFFYLPSHLVTALAVPLPRALAASLAGLGLVAIAAPVLGRLSDRIGRKPLLVAGTLVLLVVTLPAFLLIRRAGPFTLPLGYALVGLPLGCLAVVPSFLAELFPTPIRSSALAITYGLGSALFGGTAPFLATLLVQRTGNPVAPVYYAAAVTVAAAVGALLARETAFQPLDAGGVADRESTRPGRGDRRSG
jgi:MHS family proline/betaine transporter-like MFS transporter